MIQKEVADRICSPHGNKVYGILSVLIGAYYDAKMLFKVSPGVFIPPQKVDTALIRLTRRKNSALDCDEDLFKKIVKVINPYLIILTIYPLSIKEANYYPSCQSFKSCQTFVNKYTN